MKKYRIFVQGNNFKIKIDDVISKMGFFTTRYVEACDSQSAEQKTLDLIRKELDKIVLNKRTDQPMLYVKDVVELSSFGKERLPGKGFTWYKDKRRR